MPLPYPDAPCFLPDTDPCCGEFFDIAERILAAAHTGVMRCFETWQCPEPPFETAVVVGLEPEDPIGDSILVSMGPVGQLRTARDRHDASLPIMAAETIYTIQLAESGWPMLRLVNEETIEAPPRELMHVVSRHSFAHAEAMYREVVNAVVHGELMRESRDRMTVGALTPLNPAGYLAVWRLQITARIPLNRPATP